MIDLSIENKRYFLPESWQEISRKDLLIISDLYTRYIGSTDFLKYALIRMLGIRRHLVRYRDQVAFAKGLYRVFPIPAIIHLGVNRGKVKVFLQEDLLVLSQLLSWIHSSSNNTKIRSRETSCQESPFAVHCFHRLHLYGPADQLRDVIGIEYAKADAAFLAFCSTADPLYLNDLFGVLYRPKKWYWRIEKLFSDKGQLCENELYRSTVQAEFHNASSLSLHVKYAVFLFFQGCRNDLIAQISSCFLF